MSLRRKHSTVEMGSVVHYISRMTFSMSLTFFFIAVALLFFGQVGVAEQVALVITIWVTATTGFGSVLLMRKMHKSDAEFKKHKEEDTKNRGKKTLDEWLSQAKEKP